MQRDWARLGFIGAISAVVLIAVVSWHSIAGFASRAESVEHKYRVLIVLQDALSYLRDAESVQRGFLLTRDRTHLAHYSEALESVGERMEQLRTLTVDSPQQQSNLQRLESLWVEKRRSLNHGIGLARESDSFDGIVAWMRTGESRLQMERIRELTSSMIDIEARLLAQRAAESAASARTATAVVVFGSLLSIVLLLSVFYYLRREIRRRTEAEPTLRAKPRP